VIIDDGVTVIVVVTSTGLKITPIEVDPPADENSVDVDLDELPATSRTTTPRINESLLASLRGCCRYPDVSDAVLASLHPTE
jgi:hypothetical protein